MPQPSLTGSPARAVHSPLAPWATALAALLLAAVFALPVAAEEASDASDDDSSEKTFLDEVTVTATLSERAVGDIPGQVDVIGSDEIEERGYTSVTDVVRYLPGVDVDGDPSRLGANGFVIRGIGGNRVLTEIDGVPTAEQFDFGPFSIHQFALDVDALESVEIVRSAGSALYGSDALGGVVSFVTRSPRSYLGSSDRYVGTRAGWDGRSDEASLSGTVAFGGDRVQGSLLVTHRD
ncbi:MAG: TonB-dependent receptor plug domain-containing protein, partial [Acidobacteriota bacterium]